MGTQKKQKIQISIVAGIILLVTAGLGYGLWRQNRTDQAVQSGRSSDEQDSGDQTIIYEGKEYQYNEHLSNFLFLGVDTREKAETKTGQADAGQADAIFLLSWDRVEGTSYLISIPRDTLTDIQVFDQEGNSLGKSRDHISLAYAYGDGGTESCRLMEEAVSNLLYGIPLQGYCSISMDGIPALTDAVGGVDVILPDDSLADVNPGWSQGQEVHLDGTNVETFVRYRDIQKEQSALSRLERQQEFLRAYGKKAVQAYEEDASFLTELYDSLTEYMTTNIGNDWYAKILSALSQKGTADSRTIPGEGVQEADFDAYRTDDSALYEMVLEVFYEVKG